MSNFWLWLEGVLSGKSISMIAQLCSSSYSFVDHFTVLQEITLPDREKKKNKRQTSSVPASYYPSCQCAKQVKEKLQTAEQVLVLKEPIYPTDLK